ncbi:uncharacterized protein F5147DRAFT_657130 [Suillus discolor]|uniref:Uncharacterized protein n=1 Tax=Suillus discolor TaxID=1912936 RepID=A0A9P7JP70_9AGAM|nr:uncharacterized protein F5147DRAFT_657130 [Suillus discolor]KAG2094659.1 hypothetical protein F5147DRAFT_657130 [Suillus discolor]
MVSTLLLLWFTKPTLASLCNAKNERCSGNKNDLVGRLLDWHLAQNLPCTQMTLEASTTGKEVRNNQRKAEEYISASSEVDSDTLMTYTRIVLVALCSEQHLNIVSQKKILVQRLIRWRAEKDQHNNNDHGVPTDFENIHNSHSEDPAGRPSDMNDDQLHCVVLGKSLVTEIQKDMLRTELPTWFSRAPKALGSKAQDMVDAYSRFAGEDRRGTRIRDVLQWEKPVTAQGQTHPTTKEVVLEEELYSALLQLIDTTEKLRYVGEGDPSSKPEAGRITKIFLHHQYSTNDSMIEETFIALQTLIPLSDTDVPYNPYRQYPLAGGFLCYNEYHTNYHVIRPSSVICHYARKPMRVQRIRQPCVHVLPLDRLMKSTELPSLEVHDEQVINSTPNTLTNTTFHAGTVLVFVPSILSALRDSYVVRIFELYNNRLPTEFSGEDLNVNHRSIYSALSCHVCVTPSNTHHRAIRSVLDIDIPEFNSHSAASSDTTNKNHCCSEFYFQAPQHTPIWLPHLCVPPSPTKLGRLPPQGSGKSQLVEKDNKGKHVVDECKGDPTLDLDVDMLPGHDALFRKILSSGNSIFHGDTVAELALRVIGRMQGGGTIHEH